MRFEYRIRDQVLVVTMKMLGTEQFKNLKLASISAVQPQSSKWVAWKEQSWRIAALTDQAQRFGKRKGSVVPPEILEGLGCVGSQAELLNNLVNGPVPCWLDDLDPDQIPVCVQVYEGSCVKLLSARNQPIGEAQADVHSV